MRPGWFCVMCFADAQYFPHYQNMYLFGVVTTKMDGVGRVVADSTCGRCRLY